MKDLISFSARILLTILTWFAWDATYIYFSMTHLSPETKKLLEDSDTYYFLTTYGNQISMLLLSDCLGRNLVLSNKILNDSCS